MARPTLYKEEYNDQVRKLCKIGATDKDIADFFNVTVTTINNWKIKNDAFFESLKDGKLEYDNEIIAKALKHRALGYNHIETKVFSNQGEIVTYDVIKHYPPDTKACMYWLNNRQPDQWKNHPTQEAMVPIPVQVVMSFKDARIEQEEVLESDG